MATSPSTSQGVGKRFRRHTDRRNSLKERIVRGRARNPEDFWAVRDVSLQIPKGSVYGLIGHNGSGKSTLLKMIGGIYRPTEGSIVTQGRVAALIELGAGFHPDMTGRENIALNGSILGLPRKEIADVTDEIIDFSGLGDFINDPVKHYSSGMYVRLGFSVAVHMKPDVLLVDEVLAVGDEEFQRKCFDHLYALRRSGRTIIVVSHGLGQLEGLCDEIAWLEHGVMQEHGPAVDTIACLPAQGQRRRVGAQPHGGGRARRGRRQRARRRPDRARPPMPRSSISTGTPISHAETGTTFAVRVGITARRGHARPERPHRPAARLGRARRRWSATTAGASTSGRSRATTSSAWRSPATRSCPGRYRVHIDVFDYTGSRLLDSWNDAVEFAVRSPRGEIGQGLVELPVEITFD